MTTETVLTDGQVSRLIYGTGKSAFENARTIEQAVLQSEQVQAWKRDAERMEWYFGSADKTPWVPEYMRGCNDGWSVDQWRVSIDSAMDRQT